MPNTEKAHQLYSSINKQEPGSDILRRHFNIRFWTEWL